MPKGIYITENAERKPEKEEQVAEISPILYWWK